MENLYGNVTKERYQSPLHKAAAWYATMGLQIIPLHPKTKLAAVKWGTQATDDVDVINQWWQQNPNYNVGIVTGAKSGLAVVDFDTEEAWQKGQELGLPKAPIAKTGKGYHVYCKYQDGVRNFQNRHDMPGIDLRGEGGYVVAPPSVHENGNVYSWVEGKHFDDHAFGPLPEWVYVKNPVEKKPVAELMEGAGEGDRNNALTRIEGSIIGKGYSYDEAVLNAEIWNQQNPVPLPNKEVVKTVESIFKAEHGELPVMVDNWEEPILFNKTNTPEIKAELLPTWLGDYALAVSQFTQTSEAMSVMIGLSIIATCAQKRFEVAPYGDSFREPLSLWTMTVLPPSERKTPVLMEMRKPLEEWEAEQRERMAKQIREAQAKRAVALKRIEKLRCSSANTEDEAERTKLIEDMIKLESEMPDELHPPKMWTSDSTTEKLQVLLMEQGERISVIADEGGIIDVMAGMYNEGKVNFDVYLNGYPGSPLRVERAGRPEVNLRRPAVTFGLAVQPQIIEDFGSKRKQAFRGKGGLARFLFCLPQGKIGTRDIRRRSSMPEAIVARYSAGIKELLSIEKIIQANIEVPRILRLDPKALELWEDFHNVTEQSIVDGSKLSRIADWGGKLAGNCLRIAGLLHLVENGPNSLVIGKTTMARSIAICNLLVEHAIAAFGRIGADEVVNKAKKIFDWIELNEYEGFSRNDCHRALHGSIQHSDDYDKPLRLLEDRHIIKRARIATTGRPKEYYYVNPWFSEEK